jgi:hypothetical protein
MAVAKIDAQPILVVHARAVELIVPDELPAGHVGNLGGSMLNSARQKRGPGARDRPNYVESASALHDYFKSSRCVPYPTELNHRDQCKNGKRQ